MQPIFLMAPGILSVLAAGFEALSIALLLPIVQGVFTYDLSSVRAMRGLDVVLSWFPLAWTTNDKTLLLLLLLFFAAAIILKNSLPPPLHDSIR
jgi:hypothetical protein